MFLSSRNSPAGDLAAARIGAHELMLRLWEHSQTMPTLRGLDARQRFRWIKPTFQVGGGQGISLG